MDGDLRLPRLKPHRPVPRGLEAGLERIAGAAARWRARRAEIGSIADAVLGLMADSHGRAKLADALVGVRREWRTARGDRREAGLRALAAAATVAEQELGLRPHREQLIGALGLERGWLVEMATGEGKTLTLALAAALTAWRGHPCHVLTANDYLAARDAGNLRGFYDRCGVAVSAVTGETQPVERRHRYAAQVIYTTSRELTGDFLRDRIRLDGRITPESWRPWMRRRGGRGPAVLVARLHTVFVDEADQVLVDDAVTPLIISAPRKNAMLEGLCAEALAEARELTEGRDYTLALRDRRARLAETVTNGVKAEGHPLLRVPRWREEWLGKTLLALHFYQEGRHYFVRDEKIVLIDEATGRPMPDRSLGEGMHSMIEAKEGLPVSAPSETIASVSFQRFFRQVPRLAGVTGTARDAAAEFWRLYRLPVLVVPPHRPVARTMDRARGFHGEKEKWDYVAAQARQCVARGQPVLIGTRTVAASEALANRLRAEGVGFALLNGARDANEADIIAAAGRSRQVTIATNLAGRGTDIVPTEVALAAGGLRVIATERHRSKRVDRQLYGRAGRQGQPGVVEALGSWEDEVLRHHLPRWWRNAGRRWLGTGRWLEFSLAVAQWRARRWGYARRRLAVLKHDQWLDENLSMGRTPGRKSTPGG